MIITNEKQKKKVLTIDDELSLCTYLSNTVVCFAYINSFIGWHDIFYHQAFVILHNVGSGMLYEWILNYIKLSTQLAIYLNTYIDTLIENYDFMYRKKSKRRHFIFYYFTFTSFFFVSSSSLIFYSYIYLPTGMFPSSLRHSICGCGSPPTAQWN